MSLLNSSSECVRPPPAPSELFDSTEEVVDPLQQRYQPWEAAGRAEEIAVAAVVAASAVAGIDKAALAVLSEIAADSNSP
jgi:hypothetical protein